MDVRVLDLDGGVAAQQALLEPGTQVVDLRAWGPRLRLACRFGRFRRFREALADALGGPVDARSQVTFYGSGDFHHVSLALLHRLDRPFNLLVLDNHPDWVAGVPFLHCGTWLRHALALPHLGHVFHAGGDVDFDNHFRWFAPWRQLRDGRVTVLPSVRNFERGGWGTVDHEPLRPEPEAIVSPTRVEYLLRPWREELARRPLYVSIDKDVMVPADAAVNWDSGRLGLAEVGHVLEGFCRAAGGRLAGLDVVGDWSPVAVAGWFRRLLHLVEHPPLTVQAEESRARNQRTNLALLGLLRMSMLERDVVCRRKEAGHRPT
jgi:hypothetical protein